MQTIRNGKRINLKRIWYDLWVIKMILGNIFIDLIHLDTKGNSNIWIYQTIKNYNQMLIDIRYEEIVVKRKYLKIVDWNE